MSDDEFHISHSDLFPIVGGHVGCAGCSKTTLTTDGQEALKEPCKHNPEPPRLETGAIQDREDWPGVYIRGDQAIMGFLPAIKAALKDEKGPTWRMHRKTLESLAELLESCYSGNDDVPYQYVTKQWEGPE